jgi:hypothetical protein
MTTGVSLFQVVLCAALVAFGLVLHFVSRLSELEARGESVGALDYLKQHPYTAANVVLGAYGLLLLAYYTGEMGPVGSFCMGVAANAAGDKLRAQAQARIERLDAPFSPGDSK